MKNIFVTGASGFVGRNLCRELRRRKLNVRALVRNPQAQEMLESMGVHTVMGDLTDAVVMQAGMQGCDTVFHCAAKVDEWGSVDDYYQANVVGTQNALDAAQAAQVSCFVLVGTEAAYADGKSALVNLTEAMPLPSKPLPRYPATKAESEKRVRAANQPGFRTVVVRPRFIWGEDDSSVLEQIVQATDAGRMMWLDGGKQMTSTCHVMNLVHGMLLAAEQGQGGAAYFLSDGEPVQAREFISAMLQQRGVTPPTKSVPLWVVKLIVASCEPLWTRLNIKRPPPANSVVLALMGQDVTINDELARRDLGYEPVVSREQGLQSIRVPE